MSTIDVASLAQELMDAYATCRTLPAPPSARDAGFDLTTAYAVEAELVRLRRAGGRRIVGLKVGYANKAVWRALKLDTLVWAHMYDNTVRFAEEAAGAAHESHARNLGAGSADESDARNPAYTASLSLGRMCSPKIEPEIVFKLKKPLGPAPLAPADVLDAVEWLALGFEIIDCVFADWKFQPSDFVAAFGLHAALAVGAPLKVEPANIPALVDALPRFTVRLLADGQPVAEGSGRNSLRSPALCLGELASAIAKQPGAEPLAPGSLVSSGTLTESQPIAPGTVWTAVVNGLELAGLTLRTTA